MKTPTTGLMFAVMFFVLTLTACGAGRSTPIAMTTVTNSILANTHPEAHQPMTLLQAATYQGVPAEVAAEAMAKYDIYQSQVRNHLYISVIDFTQHSGHMRYFMINTKTGDVDAIAVAHGAGSDPKATGIAQYFSNRLNSKMTSLGAYLVSEHMVSSKHGQALRLDGLESTNSNARARAVILHSAKYVYEGQPKQGMSWGCPAVPVGWMQRVLTRLADGSFMYAYGNRMNSLIGDYEDAIGQMINPGHAYIEDGAEAPADGIY